MERETATVHDLDRRPAPPWVLPQFQAAAADLAELSPWQPHDAWLQAGMLHIAGADLTLVVSVNDRGSYAAVTGAVGWSYRAVDGPNPQALARCKALAAHLAPKAADFAQVLLAAQPPVVGAHGLGFARLRQDFQRLARGPRLDYPVQVNVETYATCPASCTFCTYPTMDRKGTRMSDALLDKIIGDLAAIPRDIPFAFCPFLISEPFADKRLHAILERLEREVPNAAVCLITTGTLLDAKHIARLRERKNIAEVVISLNFCDPAEYEATMGIPWARTWAHVTALHTAAREHGLPFRVPISRVRGDVAADNQFRAFVSRELPAFEARMIDRHGWLGRVEAPVRDLEELPCTQWFELKVTATGAVALCCQDAQAQHVIGDVNAMSLLDIYNQPAARAQRAALTARKTFASCKGCGFSRVVGPVDPDYFSRP